MSASARYGAAPVRRAFAPAKVNLTLHVTGRGPDGRHLLDSLVAFADIGDVLEARPGDALTVSGPFASGMPTDDANLIRRALAAAGAARAIHLTKDLPHPAGIGGGSSDAAAALRLIDAELPTDALMALGADLPVCFAARAARMRGTGEVVDAVRLPVLHAVLVHPGVALPTRDVFAALERADGAGHGAMPDGADGADGAEATAWLAAQRNDLEPAALRLAPIVADVLCALRGAGAGVARMSGSGATCFGLWPTRIAAAAAAAALGRSGWWVRACSLA